MMVTYRLFSSEICVPSLRGDGVADTVKSFGEINSLDDFERALKNRINEFKKSGCRVADHALDNGFSYYKDDGKNNERFLSLLNETITEEDKKKLSSYLLTFMGRQYAKNGFIMQLHIGAQRETSSKLRSAAGKEGGFAAMGNSVNVKSLIEFLEALDESCGLPKTILFTLNPADNALISTISGSFVKDNVKGLITQGPAWWWCDHIKTGDSKRDESIEKVIKMFPIMRELDINCICFNWMAHIGWLRTSDKIIERGGAFVTGYDEKEFNVTDAKISEKELWDNYKYFLDAVIPYAEKYDINLALHPDDPPVKKLGDVSRIMISAENIRKAIYDIHPSQNLGITMCQANYYIMGEDVEKVIKEFAQKILFIHFRNVTGNLHKFNETFHDNGDLPMRKLIKLYKELDINVPIRVDHVPTLKNENTDVAGYGALGRLFAIGYLKGLVENDKSN